MNDCIWSEYKGKYRCVKCGKVQSIQSRRNCKRKGSYQFPTAGRQAWNLATSVVDFVMDGCKTLSSDEYKRRLAICDNCEFRRENRCARCGCRLSMKARGRAFQCPEHKWESPAAPTLLADPGIPGQDQDEPHRQPDSAQKQ